MKNTYNPVSDVRIEGVDLAKRLYRGISDVSRQLDERRGRAQTCSDLFLPSLETQRVKLREYCERLMFTDPAGYGFKGEEILWRKGYYDVVASAKRLRKNNKWNPLEITYLQNHLASGVGHYYHFILRLQMEFKLDLRGLTDFPLLVNDEGLTKIKTPSSKLLNAESLKWARDATHRSLVYLGDLSRYFLDLYPEWDTGLSVRYYLQALNMNSEIGRPHNQLGTLSGEKNFSIDAAYHYMRCLMCPQPFEGAEGNLQRIFEKNNKWLEDRYSESEGNLVESSLSPAEHIHYLTARFMLLADVWFFDKSVLHINELCHQIVGDLVQCLKYNDTLPLQAGSAEYETEDNPTRLKEEIILKMVIISFMCAGKLKSKKSVQHSIAVAFILGILSKLVHQVINQIEDSVFHRSLTSYPFLSSPSKNETLANSLPTNSDDSASNAPLINASSSVPPLLISALMPSETHKETNGRKEPSARKKKNPLAKLRRRRRRRINSDDSCSDSYDGSNSSCCEDDDSDNEEHLAFSTEDEETDEETTDDEVVVETADRNGSAAPDSAEKTNGFTANNEDVALDSVELAEVNGVPVAEPERSMDPADVIELVTGDRILDIVKVLFDWLRGDQLVVEECSVGSRDLLTEIITLLNFINVDVTALKTDTAGAKIFKLADIEDVFSKVPLPEDILLKGICLTPFEKAHSNIDWEYQRHHRLHAKEEALIRVYKLIDFGHFLVSKADLGVTFDAEKREFSVADELPKRTSNQKDTQPLEAAKEPTKAEKGTLMKSMHTLWLRGEVKALESRKHGKGPIFSPYLAVDVDALILHTHLVKQLVEARKFIVLVPTVVIAALDDLKGEVPRAREINRWLGLQHEQVNRFVRVQGPNERTPIALIKYPKKKDKEAWVFFQVVECCQFFNTKYGSNPNVPLVTLLSGQKNCNVIGANDEAIKGFSPMGIAKTAGINLEYIETFHAKWKTSSKSPG